MIVARILCENQAALWTLAANCQPFLGPADALTLLAENAIASSLGPWRAGGQGAWTLGRIFGAQGELRWRTYGPVLRGLLVTDGLPNARPDVAIQRLQEFGFLEIEAPQLAPSDRTLPLWRTADYVAAQVRRYVDGAGNELWLRYRGVTPTPPQRT
jgi:hypothetical protein